MSPDFFELDHMANKNIFIIAGEASGDILGAGLMKALRRRMPDVEFHGAGGEEMERIEGFKSIFDIKDIAAMGVVEVLRRLPTIMARIKQTAAEILRSRPDLIVTIDAPGFNMQVVKRVRKSWPEAKAMHYVAPSVWAWKPKRAEKVAALYDYLLCFFPFEAKYFERHGLKTHVVGHVANDEASGNALRFRKTHGLGAKDTIITMLPGSRAAMAERLLPILEKAAEILEAQIPGLKIAMPTVSTSRAFIEERVNGWKARPILVARRQERYDAFAASSAALSISGTAVLELALMKVPTVALYKVSPVSYFIARRFVKAKYVTLPNIIAGKEIVPEFIQDEATPEALAAAFLKFLKNKAARAKYSRDAEDLREELGANSGRASSDMAAQAVLEALAEK
jgi:lipid-A-disaccharide synthase